MTSVHFLISPKQISSLLKLETSKIVLIFMSCKCLRENFYMLCMTTYGHEMSKYFGMQMAILRFKYIAIYSWYQLILRTNKIVLNIHFCLKSGFSYFFFHEFIQNFSVLLNSK